MRKAYNHAKFSFPEIEDDSCSELVHPTEIAEHFELVARLTQASHSVTGRKDWFTRDEEHELADRIQDGVIARGVIRQLGNLYDGRFEEILHDSEVARTDLVVANLPFAAYYARLSTGWTPSNRDRSKTVDIGSDTSRYFGMVKAPGKYTPLHKLRHPNASLEDRTQIAMEAMWKSANSFRSEGSARFIGYAGWAIQQALGYALNDDKNEGWSLTRTLDKTYADLLLAEENKEEVHWPTHIQENDKPRSGFHPLQVREGRKAIHYEAVNLSRMQGIELLDSEEPKLTLPDVTPSMDTSPSAQAEYNEMLHTLDLVMSTLSEREQTVIRLRFGIADGSPKTLQEVADVIGRTRESARKIESKTMSKLRHPLRSQLLRDYVGIEEVRDTDASGGKAVRGASWIKTKRTENINWS